MYGKLSEDKKQIQKVNENVLAELYPGLQRYCLFLAQNQWDGEDIAQQTILKAMQKYKYNSQLSSALLKRMAYNQWMDILRKRKREAIGEIPELASSRDICLIETVECLLEQLTPKQAIIFTLKEAFQYKAAEIARVLKTTETAVKSSLYRAKKRISKDDSFSAGSFWNEEEYTQLFSLIYESLKVQDPTILLNSISLINSLADDPKVSGLATRTKISKKSFTPSCTFCMAA